MDNVTHTVAGFLLAEATVRVRAARDRSPTPTFPRAAYAISAAGNNLPDLDFVYARVTRPPKLGYLLHHRGHSHTFLVAIAAMTLALLALPKIAPRLRRALKNEEWHWLLVLGALGPVVHIAMDFSNNYGVHPLWPLYSGWFYGDFVFIVEPAFLALGLPVLFFTLELRLARGLVAILLFASILLVWWVPILPRPVAASITALSLGALWLAHRLSPSRRIGFGLGASLGVAALFALARGRAHDLVMANLRAQLARPAAIQDVVLTPAPADPLCWSAWVVRTEGERYIAESATISALATVWPVERCRSSWGATTPTAPLEPARLASSDGVAWGRRFVAPLGPLRELWAKDCEAAAFLRYARVPYWTTDPSGAWIVGDLRYDRRPPLEFAEIALSPSSPCPRWIPPWIPPRGSLLSGAQTL